MGISITILEAIDEHRQVVQLNREENEDDLDTFRVYYGKEDGDQRRLTQFSTSQTLVVALRCFYDALKKVMGVP